MDDLGAAIVAAARECVGTPFRHQGRLPKIGLDCAGLVIYAARAQGLPVIDFKGYPDRPFDGMLKRMLDSQTCIREIYITDIQPGDLLLMRVNHDPQHLAIVSENNYIIHTFQDIGKVAEHRMDLLARAKILNAYRFKRE
jgi:cell wall-associated NlpC family hydrolase